jgi:hypothetical protein
MQIALTVAGLAGARQFREQRRQFLPMFCFAQTNPIKGGMINIESISKTGLSIWKALFWLQWHSFSLAIAPEHCFLRCFTSGR